MARKPAPEQITRYADMLGAMGTEPRLRIMQLLLSAHPDGMVVGEIGSDLDIPSSTLSHHLGRLKSAGLLAVRRDSTFLWYSVDAEAMANLLRFLCAECCTNKTGLTVPRT
jgi:ArsR family transcriptional regulator